VEGSFNHDFGLPELEARLIVNANETQVNLG
jgi:hypothetical protein